MPLLSAKTPVLPSFLKVLRLCSWRNAPRQKRSLAGVEHLAIDETSFRRGHKYVTLAIDAYKRCVIDIEPGRDKQAGAMICQALVTLGGDPERIKTVTSDMSTSFLPAIEEFFPMPRTSSTSFTSSNWSSRRSKKCAKWSKKPSTTSVLSSIVGSCL